MGLLFLDHSFLCKNYTINNCKIVCVDFFCKNPDILSIFQNFEKLDNQNWLSTMLHNECTISHRHNIYTHICTQVSIMRKVIDLESIHFRQIPNYS